MIRKVFFLCVSYFIVFSVHAQQDFVPLDLPTPNSCRTGAGAPGPSYWQPQVDYDIQVELDDENQQIIGSEKVTFHNNSPETLHFVWVQLDQNLFEPHSVTNETEHGHLSDDMKLDALRKMMVPFDGGYKISKIADKSGKELSHIINNTMMRVDLPKPLAPGKKVELNIDWSYNITEHAVYGGRSGYEYFKEDDNYLYEIAQFFPRLAVFTDYMGWQNKQFLGEAEWALPFGNYKVAITTPADHVVAATGELKNEKAVLSKTQRERLAQARKSEEQVWIITEEEAKANEKSRAKDKKTWVFEAENVRDFAFASSRKFVWDAVNVPLGGKGVLAMSLYPKEGNPMWGKYATASVAHALKVYSKYTLDYPYPVAIAIHGPIFGMEYPMISFNGARPDANGNYSQRLKEIMISVIIHETGHNFFPMIINSDERRWAWMDEGLNSFIQYLAEQEWREGYDSRRGPAYKIANFMASDKDKQVPIMTNPESINQMGNITYGKTATALAILRDVVMGPELFDAAFKEYSRRWAFKHPTPADFFRTMQDASAVDLDWFFRGWFYTTDHVDIAIENPKYKVLNKDTEEKKKTSDDSEGIPLTSTYDFAKLYKNMSESDRKLVDEEMHFYELTFRNVGGLIMPIILEMQFEDGTSSTQKVPVEVWRKNDKKVTKVFITDKPVKQFVLDPKMQTADTDLENNVVKIDQKAKKMNLLTK
ncbi:M1 family metallopeptidase [Cytophagaceae bacterium ABcell3]|nr:M1 family metallopeptidase [Cytophagaceae bacterium ABcell3]